MYRFVLLAGTVFRNRATENGTREKYESVPPENFYLRGTRMILRAKMPCLFVISKAFLPFRGGPGRTFVGAAPTGAKARASPETSHLLPSRVMSSPESKKLLGARCVPPRACGRHHPETRFGLDAFR